MTFETMNVILLGAMLAAGVWSVMTSDLLRSAIGLALVSVILTLQLFLLKAPLAAVFELSVCAGLITVVFISTISLTRSVAKSEVSRIRTSRLRRFVLLPVILAIAAWYLNTRILPLDIQAHTQAVQSDVQHMLWYSRRFDLIGQILVILAGIFGVIVLFKTKNAEDGDAQK